MNMWITAVALMIMAITVDGFLMRPRSYSPRVGQLRMDVDGKEQSSSSSKSSDSSKSRKKFVKSLISSLLVCGSLMDGNIQPSGAATTSAVGLETAIVQFEKAEGRDDTVQAFADLYEAAGTYSNLNSLFVSSVFASHFLLRMS